MENKITIASWNLCLGLSNKKDSVIETLKQNDIQICCLQETEIDVNFPEKVLNCSGFNIELETNTVKKRTGIYLRTDVKYNRRTDLEKNDMHIIIVDVICDTNFRVINIYRSFRPPNGITPDALFKGQLDLIKAALCSNCIVMGDFNLDVGMSNRNDYDRKIPLTLLNEFALNNDLIQVINFKTWTRTIKGTKKESTLDHVYVNNLASVINVHSICPTFGDHLLIMVDLNFIPTKNKNVYQKRNWKKYSPELFSNMLKNELDLTQCNWSVLNVCDHWNKLEHVLINCVDRLAPLRDCENVNNFKSQKVPSNVKQKINKRNYRC